MDLTNITSMSIGVTGVVAGTPKFEDAPAKRKELPFAKLDNIRLSRRDAAAKHPVIRDDSTYVLRPDYYLPATKPQPRPSTEGQPMTRASRFVIIAATGP